MRVKKPTGAARITRRIRLRREAGKPEPSNWNRAVALRAARDREIERHVASILNRVGELHPGNDAAQRRALSRWARILWANDRDVATRLLDARAKVRAA